MFCPECGTMAFPNGGIITCTNYKCGYHGPVGKMKVQGKEIDLGDVQSSSKAETREYEIIKDSDQMKGVLTTGDYMCPNPKCNGVEVYSYLEQTRSSDEPETRMLTCKDCGRGWREY